MTIGERIRHAWTSARVRAVLSLGFVAGLAVATTSAYWTDTATATATISTGSIDLRLGAAAVDNDPVETTSFSISDMVPGSTKDQPLPVANVGTVPITYAMSVTASGGLASGLRMQVYSADSDGACTGTVVADGLPMSAASFSGRPLAAGGHERLCLRVTLPVGASSALQGTSATATLTFTATSR
ncbi:SipW-dependent-type signal peptide-containing protein [Nocardioidaceae bacterium SCSIO 66511]|nr:SipW-dependent-type signal peptide-containing protein [Nocardioidaceae bacterium SCSIO 66511]